MTVSHEEEVLHYARVSCDCCDHYEFTESNDGSWSDAEAIEALNFNAHPITFADDGVLCDACASMVADVADPDIREALDSGDELTQDQFNTLCDRIMELTRSSTPPPTPRHVEPPPISDFLEGTRAIYTSGNTTPRADDIPL